MSRFMFLALLVSFWSLLLSQTVVFTEDWETGFTDWTIVNHTTAPNQWVWGEAASQDGSYSMYISNDLGVTNSYQIGYSNGAATSVAHFYHDFTFPIQANLFSISFDIRSNGESNYDFVRVYLMPTSVTPEARNTSFSAEATSDPYLVYRIGRTHYNVLTLTEPVGDWHHETIYISNEWADQEARLVFTWVNDSSGGNQPPGAIDNIAILLIEAVESPFPAVVVGPKNEAIFVSVATTLSWSANSSGMPATGYTVYLDTENPPTTDGIDVGGVTTYIPENLLSSSTTYYWRVVPYNQGGATDIQDCPIWSFDTIEPNKIAIGDGSSVAKTIPFNMNAEYSVSQTIYYAEELSDMPLGSEITDLAYHYISTAIDLDENIDIYIGHTELSRFATASGWIAINTLTHVYSGAITATQPDSYAILTLNMEPFIYEGGNIVVCVTELVSGRTTAHSGSNWLQSSYPDQYRSINCNSNYEIELNDLPMGTRTTTIANTIFSYTPPMGNHLYLEPAILEIGVINQNVPATVELTLFTVAEESITIFDIECSDGISTTQEFPFTIEPNDSYIVTFTILASDLTDDFTSEITISSDADNGPTHIVSVKGAVYPENMIEISGGRERLVTSVPIHQWSRYSVSQSIYLSSDLERADGKVISRLQYHYNAYLNYTQEVSVYMGHSEATDFATNTVESFVPFDTLSLVYQGPFVMSTEIDAISGGYWVDIPLDGQFIYDSAQNLVIAVLENQGGAYGSMSAGFYHKPTTDFRSISITRDDHIFDPLALSGAPSHMRSVPNIRMYVENPSLGAFIAINPREIAFGDVSQYETYETSLTISNIGTDDLVVNAITLPAEIQCEIALPLIVAPMDSATIDLVFTPTLDGNFSQLVTINSNAVNDSTYTISATARVLPRNIFYVGDDTLTDLSLPFEPYYRFTYSQTIYLPNDLVEMPDGAEITHIGYQFNGNATFTENVRIYMGHTDRSAFSAINIYGFVPVNTLTLVYDGPLSVQRVPDAWTIIPLSETIEYDASYNLIVAVNEYHGGAFAPANCDFYCTETPTTQSMVMYQNNPEAFDENALVTPQNHDIYTRSAIPNTAFSFLYSGNGLPRPRYLTGEVGNGFIALNWQPPNISSDDETPTFLGYNVYRNGMEIIGGLSRDILEYYDMDLASDEYYTYYITATYEEGESAPSNTFSANALSDSDEMIVSIPTKLQGNYPNPFNPSTTIAFDLARTGHVALDIYNIKGQKVRSLVNNVMEAGQHTVVWNGADDVGHSVSSGVYFYRMTTVGHSQLKKMLLLK